MRNARCLMLLAIVLLLASSPIAITAQTAGSHPPHQEAAAPRQSGVNLAAPGSTTVMSLVVAVDGAKTPDKIPDDIAYRHFIRVTAESEAATPQQLARRDAFLRRVGLSPRDSTAYLDALTHVNAQLKTIAQQNSALSPSASPDAIANLRQQERQVLDSALVRIKSSLSPAGIALLETHIRQHVKRHIVLYGDWQ